MASGGRRESAAPALPEARGPCHQARRVRTPGSIHPVRPGLQVGVVHRDHEEPPVRTAWEAVAGLLELGRQPPPVYKRASMIHASWCTRSRRCTGADTCRDLQPEPRGNPMTADQALEIASQYVQQETGRLLRPMGDARIDPTEPRRWVVAFEWTTPEGSRVDGPVVVRVDNESGKAEFFVSL